MKGKAKEITLWVNLKDNIDEVKSKIEIQEGTPADQQRLFLSRANRTDRWQVFGTSSSVCPLQLLTHYLN
jgi:hypothetical protein